MSQGHIYRTRDGQDLICRVQADLGLDTPLILVAPVVVRSDWGGLTPKLHIPITLTGTAYVIVMSQMLALPQREIGEIISTDTTHRDALITAVDLLVSGF